MDANQNYLLNRCLKTHGISKSAIYREAWQVLNTQGFSGHTVLDLGSGVGDFRNFVEAQGSFSVEECDVCFDDGRPGFRQIDLSKDFDLGETFDLVTIIEAIHMFENPRHLVRQAKKHMRPGGYLLVTIPNLLSFTSTLSFMLRGCHSMFYGRGYPMMITPIHLIDLQRMMVEAGLTVRSVGYVKEGRIPGQNLLWQQLPLGKLLTNRRFCDHLAVVAVNASTIQD